MKKILTVILSVYLGLVLLMPKEQIIYTILNQANRQLINFEIEDMKDFGVYENIDGLSIIYDKMRVAKIENIKILPLIFYDKINITSISPAGTFKSMFSEKVYKASATYVVYLPFKIMINADTSIGKIDGNFNLKNHKIKLVLHPNKNFRRFKYKNYFKKQKGGYVYESIIR